MLYILKNYKSIIVCPSVINRCHCHYPPFALFPSPQPALQYFDLVVHTPQAYLYQCLRVDISMMVVRDVGDIVGG